MLLVRIIHKRQMLFRPYLSKGICYSNIEFYPNPCSEKRVSRKEINTVLQSGDIEIALNDQVLSFQGGRYFLGNWREVKRFPFTSTSLGGCFENIFARHFFDIQS